MSSVAPEAALARLRRAAASGAIDHEQVAAAVAEARVDYRASVRALSTELRRRRSDPR